MSNDDSRMTVAWLRGDSDDLAAVCELTWSTRRRLGVARGHPEHLDVGQRSAEVNMNKFLAHLFGRRGRK